MAGREEELRSYCVWLVMALLLVIVQSLLNIYNTESNISGPKHPVVSLNFFKK